MLNGTVALAAFKPMTTTENGETPGGKKVADKGFELFGIVASPKKNPFEPESKYEWPVIVVRASRQTLCGSIPAFAAPLFVPYVRMRLTCQNTFKMQPPCRGQAIAQLKPSITNVKN
jgi:hypothetical protein